MNQHRTPRKHYPGRCPTTTTSWGSSRPAKASSTRSTVASRAARVGQRTDYDKLVLDVTTDGSIEPRDAIGQLVTHFR